MPSPYSIPIRARLARHLLRPVFQGLFHLLSRVAITGREHVPKFGAYVIAINHVSLYEPPLVLSFWPVATETIGAVEIWQKKGQSTLARLYGAIPIHRGEADRSTLETMIAVLESGRPLMIAPEGGRSHTPGMRPGKPGMAYVVDKTRVPVVPVGLVGTTDDFWERASHGERPTLEMRIGPLVRLPPIQARGAERRTALQQNVDAVMMAIAALLPQEYRGVYS